jgi:hypothetical protein
MDTSTPPSITELSVDEAWDRLLDTTLRRAVYGGLAGGAAALVLLRKFVFVARGGACVERHRRAIVAPLLWDKPGCRLTCRA